MPKTGATRYQKFLKSEKAKTKLKAKKDLPKGTNVTKTNFQVRKIVIKEQLKQHGQNEALTTRKLNVKELLSRLNHHNIQTQFDAIEGLNELLTVHPEILEKSLGQLVHGISPMLLNIERKVRLASHKLLSHILSTVGAEKLEPFYNILSTYLRSGMTHIDSRIQDDSLLFLDILLNSIPKLVTLDFHKIIPNFLDMISKLRVDSKPGRILSVNMDSQISTVKWRVKVLHRLRKFFQYYVEYCSMDEKVNSEKAFIKFNENDEAYYSLHNINYTSICPVLCFTSKSLQDVVQIDEVKKFSDYTEILIPLLFETWVEVCPKTNTEDIIETVVDEDTASLLKHILELLSLIWKLVQHLDKKNPNGNIFNNLSQKYRKQFNQHFIQLFPFVTNIRSKQCNTSSEIEETVTDPKLVVQNLEMCYLYIMLNQHLNLYQKNEVRSVVIYIAKIFVQKELENVSDIIIKILNTIFSKYILWTKISDIMKLLLPKIIQTYFCMDKTSPLRQQLYTLLCNVALNNKLKHVQCHEAFKKFIKSIPDVLLEESILPQTIDVIHKFAVQNNIIFNYIIKFKLLKIVENLPVIVITEPHSESDYLKLFSILYYIKYFDFESLNILEIQILNNVYGDPKHRYVLDILRMRSSLIKPTEEPTECRNANCIHD